MASAREKKKQKKKKAGKGKFFQGFPSRNSAGNAASIPIFRVFLNPFPLLHGQCKIPELPFPKKKKPPKPAPGWPGKPRIRKEKKNPKKTPGFGDSRRSKNSGNNPKAAPGIPPSRPRWSPEAEPAFPGKTQREFQRLTCKSTTKTKNTNPNAPPPFPSLLPPLKFPKNSQTYPTPPPPFSQTALQPCYINTRIFMDVFQGFSSRD